MANTSCDSEWEPERHLGIILKIVFMRTFFVDGSANNGGFEAPHICMIQLKFALFYFFCFSLWQKSPDAIKSGAGRNRAASLSW